MVASQERVHEIPQQTYLDVQAPTDLREGYILWVNTENGCLPVQVPSGGVLGGQTVTMAVIVHQDNETETDIPPIKEDTTGQWNHGLCSCFRRGLCHPHAWSICFCPEIFLPPLLRRLKLDWAGSTTPIKNKSTTLRNGLIALIVFSYIATWFLRAPSSVASSRNNNQWSLTSSEILFWEISYVILTLPAAIYGLMVAIRLRAAIRANANIPTGCLGYMEDCCCVFMCYGCTVSQMAGQVLEDDDEAALATCRNMMGGACGTTTVGTDKEESAV
eukprot:Nitzschia sp. Nitz4//scaffold344_size17659//13562//14566//NITZ4_008813-RA/size17659-snap-gene-0.32-mRNA-1//1//CDS//3329548618//8595//frame0